MVPILVVNLYNLQYGLTTKQITPKFLFSFATSISLYITLDLQAPSFMDHNCSSCFDRWNKYTELKNSSDTSKK